MWKGRFVCALVANRGLARCLARAMPSNLMGGLAGPSKKGGVGMASPGLPDRRRGLGPDSTTEPFNAWARWEGAPWDSLPACHHAEKPALAGSAEHGPTCRIRLDGTKLDRADCLRPTPWASSRRGASAPLGTSLIPSARCAETSAARGGQRCGVTPISHPGAPRWRTSRAAARSCRGPHCFRVTAPPKARRRLDVFGC